MNLYVFHNNSEFVSYLNAQDSAEVIAHITADKTGQKTDNFITIEEGEHPPLPSHLSIVNNQVTVLTGDALATSIAAEEAQLELNELRTERDKRLASSDWTQGIDSPLSDTAKAQWQVYRQTLRDITNTHTSLSGVIWPSKP